LGNIVNNLNLVTSIICNVLQEIVDEEVAVFTEFRSGKEFFGVELLG